MKSLNESALRTLVKLQVESEQRFGKKLLSKPDTATENNSDSEDGSTTVEYAIGAVATAAFAGLLLAVLKSGGVKNMLNNIIQTALSM